MKIFVDKLFVLWLVFFGGVVNVIDVGEVYFVKEIALRFY